MVVLPSPKSQVHSTIDARLPPVDAEPSKNTVSAGWGSVGEQGETGDRAARDGERHLLPSPSDPRSSVAVTATTVGSRHVERVIDRQVHCLVRRAVAPGPVQLRDAVIGGDRPRLDSGDNRLYR